MFLRWNSRLGSKPGEAPIIAGHDGQLTISDEHIAQLVADPSIAVETDPLDKIAVAVAARITAAVDLMREEATNGN